MGGGVVLLFFFVFLGDVAVVRTDGVLGVCVFMLGIFVFVVF